MTNLITDGFDWFPSSQSSSVRDRLWAANEFFKFGSTGAPHADVVQGRFDFGQAFSYNYGVTGANRFAEEMNGYVVPIGATPATGFMGFAVTRFSDTGHLNPPALAFFDAVNNDFQVSITFEPNGVIRVWRGDKTDNLPLAASVAGVFQDDQWFHFEVKATIDGSSGAVECRVNTVPVIQLVSANTKKTANAYFDSVFLGVHQGAATTGGDGQAHIAFDDMFVNDTTGTSNNDWAGNLRVKTQFMTANGATDTMTIGGSSPAATHWQSVLNQILDDTKYVYSASVGDLDLYTPDPNLNAPYVRAVQVRMGLRQDDATQRVGRALLRIGSTNYLGVVDQYTNQTYTFYKERWQLSPATGVTFTGSEVNGLQAGLKVQA